MPKSKDYTLSRHNTFFITNYMDLISYICMMHLECRKVLASKCIFHPTIAHRMLVLAQSYNFLHQDPMFACSTFIRSHTHLWPRTLGPFLTFSRKYNVFSLIFVMLWALRTQSDCHGIEGETSSSTRMRNITRVVVQNGPLRIS